MYKCRISAIFKEAKGYGTYMVFTFVCFLSNVLFCSHLIKTFADKFEKKMIVFLFFALLYLNFSFVTVTHGRDGTFHYLIVLICCVHSNNDILLPF